MLLESSKPSNLDVTFIIVLCSIVVALIVIAVVITIVVKKNRKKINIDGDYIKGLIDNLGGKNNISEIDVDGRKLKVSVNDLSIVNLEVIKQLAQAGIFVSGNNIKALYKYDAEDLKKGLKLYMKE